MANHTYTVTLTDDQQKILANDLYTDTDMAGLDTWIAGAVTGKIISRIVAGEKTNLDLSPYSSKRFS